MNAKKGFTLIELLVVIAIIGILSTIVMVSVSVSKQKGRDARRTADLKTIQLSLEEFYNDYYYYPTALTTLSPTYIATLPTDPLTHANYYYYALTTDSGGACASVKPVKYHIGAAMEANTNVLDDVDAPAAGGSGVFSGFYACSGSTAFDGNAPLCVGTTPASSGDNCDDMTN